MSMSTHMSAAQLAQQHNRGEVGRYAEMLLAEPGQLNLEPVDVPVEPATPAGQYLAYLPAPFEQMPHQQTVVRPMRASFDGGQCLEPADDWNQIDGVTVQPGDVIRVQARQVGGADFWPHEFEGQVRTVRSAPWTALNQNGEPAQQCVAKGTPTPVFEFTDGTTVHTEWPYTDVLFKQTQGEPDPDQNWTVEQHQADLVSALESTKSRMSWAKGFHYRDQRDDAVAAVQRDIATIKHRMKQLRTDPDRYVTGANQAHAQQLANRSTCAHLDDADDLHGVKRCIGCGRRTPRIPAGIPAPQTSRP